MKEIVEAARGGDKSAFTRLYQETYNRVYFYAFKLFGNQEDAADVVQDVFVKVFTGIGELKSTEAFTSWLYRITVNECKNKV
ncbi:MAG: RNA polymerase sigma factor, partial [Anaerovoracaceae bacterium]